MIYEIKITAEPGQSIVSLKPFIYELISRANKKGIEVKTFKKQNIKCNFEHIVCEEVSKYLKEEVTVRDLMKRTRKNPVVYSRQIIMKKMITSNVSLQNAAHRFGMDHATASHSKKVVNNMYETDFRYRAMIQRIEERTKCKII